MTMKWLYIISIDTAKYITTIIKQLLLEENIVKVKNVLSPNLAQ